MKKNIGVILRIFAIISLFSVGVFAQHNLTRYAWELTRLNGRNMPDSNALINFDSARKGISGNAGCNRMFGSYSVNGRSIKFSKIGTTKMFCAKPGVMKEEADFTRALSAATRYSISGNRLRIYSGRREVLEFERQLPGISLMSDSLARKKWYLDGQKAPRAGASKDSAFIVFDKEKGSAGGNTGCNVFGGSYKVDNDQAISITEVISTMRACIEDDRMNVERKFLSGVRDATRYHIENDKLSLYNGRTLLLTFTGYDK